MLFSTHAWSNMSPNYCHQSKICWSKMFQLISAIFCSKKSCCICWLDLDRETAHFVFSRSTNIEIKRSNMSKLSTIRIHRDWNRFTNFLTAFYQHQPTQMLLFHEVIPPKKWMHYLKNISPQRSQTFHPPTPHPFVFFSIKIVNVFIGRLAP